MAYSDKKMLEDINGDLIPQYYDPVEDEFKPLTNDPIDTRLIGSNVELIKTLVSHNVDDQYFGDTIGLTSNTDFLDVSKYRKIVLLVDNNTEQFVTLGSLVFNGFGSRILGDYRNITSLGDVDNVPSHAFRYISGGEIPGLGNLQLPNMYLYLDREGEGELKIHFIGVKS